MARCHIYLGRFELRQCFLHFAHAAQQLPGLIAGLGADVVLQIAMRNRACHRHRPVQRLHDAASYHHGGRNAGDQPDQAQDQQFQRGPVIGLPDRRGGVVECLALEFQQRQGALLVDTGGRHEGGFQQLIGFHGMSVLLQAHDLITGRHIGFAKFGYLLKQLFLLWRLHQPFHLLLNSGSTFGR